LLAQEQMPLPAGAALPTIPGYELLGELGRGGMGVVYKARQQGLNRLVALKMIRTGPLASPDEVARFRVEAEAVARLEHPHIVQIHEIGECHGLPYLCLEFVDGGSVADRLRTGPQPAGPAADLVETLARAMDVAHRRGIVHRDLKPANVLLTSDGRPKISDFGLAKRLEEVAGRTASDVVLGTPSYMAPEQIPGVGPAVGPAADIYALGALLYECLTGRPPFYGMSVLETVEHVRFQEPVPPTRLLPRVPRDVETICLKCLNKEPARRYATAADLAEDLRRFRAGEPIRARPVGAAERLIRWSRRNPVVAGLLAAVVGLLLAGSGFSAFFAVQADWRAREAEETANRLATETEHVKRERLRALRHLYVAHMNQAHQAWKDGQIRRLTDLLDSQTPQHTAGQDFRHFEWYYLRRLPATGHGVLAGRRAQISCLATCPESERIAAGTFSSDEAKDDAELRLWDVGSGKVVRSFNEPCRLVIAVALSSDGSRLASLGLLREHGPVLRVWDTSDGRELLRRPLKDHFGRGLAFSPGGKYLAACDATAIQLWETSTWREKRVPFAQLPNLALCLTFSGDGEQVVVGLGPQAGSWSPNLLALDVATGKQAFGLRDPGAVLVVAASRDGQWLATAGADFQIRVWDARARTLKWVLHGHTAYPNTLTFGRDGRRLLSAARDGTVRIWDLATGTQERDFKGHPGSVVGAAFGPKDRWIVSAGGDDDLWMWPPKAEQDARTRKSSLLTATSLGFSPDGKTLAAAQIGVSGIALLAADSGQSVGCLGDSIRLGGTFALAFSPDGRRLVRVGKGWDLWDVSARKRVASNSGESKERLAAAFRVDGSEFVVTDADEVAVLDAETGTRIRAFPAGGVGGRTVAYSPDGRFLALDAKGHTTELWDAATGKIVHAFPAHPSPVLKVAFRSDGRRLLSASASAVQVWDPVTGKSVHSFTVKGPQETGGPWSMWARSTASFTNDGERLAIAYGDGTVRIWDVETGQQTLALQGPAAQIVGVAFSPDGRRLAASGIEGTSAFGGINGVLRLWDATTPR
jgi:WD40 repeat protein